MTRSVYVLRIVKSPRWTTEPGAGSNASFYRPGLYCAGVLEAFRGGPLVLATFHQWPLDAAASLAAAEKRHPGMEVEIVEFKEQTDTSKVTKDAATFARAQVSP